MPRRTKVPILVVAALWLQVASALGWQWHHAGRAAQEARAAWAIARAERDRLARVIPAATTEGSAVIDAAVAAAEGDLAARRQMLVPGTANIGVEESPLEFWYEAVATHDRLRALADELGVALAPDEQFGLASPLRTGPSEAELPVVTRQRATLEQLVRALIAAQPRRLLSVQRERPRETSGGEPTDFFRMEPRLSVRIPGTIEPTAFRLEFTGRTAVLRAFLNGVMSTPEPWFVRSVEVVPLSGLAARASRSEAGLEPEERPIVAPTLSRFIVTIEHVALASPPSR